MNPKWKAAVDLRQGIVAVFKDREKFPVEPHMFINGKGNSLSPLEPVDFGVIAVPAEGDTGYDS